MPDEELVSIPHAITRAAARNPDHPALSMNGQELTYGGLAARVNSFASMLAANGVRPGDRVGLYAHKSIEVFVALFGTMQAGALYVPINPDAPAAYVRHILDDCDIDHLVVSRTTWKTAKLLAADGALRRVIGHTPDDSPVDCIGWEEVWDHSTSAPSATPDLDDLAYIIFTSGSTGRPKGIVHTHRSGLAYGQVAAATYGFRPDDRIANHPPLNFDLSLLELWGGVVAGATIVIIPEAHARLWASLSQLLQDERVTVLNAVPFALTQLLHRGALDERDLTALRWVLFGGEVPATKDLRALMTLLPNARFGNVYGPAEVNGVTYYIVPDLPEDSDEPISIGSLYPGMEALVVDEDDEEVPPGEPGELLIHSPTHMVGYWRRPNLTAAATAHRSGRDGTTKRWHRTGDIVAQGADGLFRFVGRKDRMVKVRGHRIELDEVEAALLGHEAVARAVVFAVPDVEGSQRIEAVVTLRPGLSGTVDVETLTAHAGRHLPRYAVPRALRITDTVPLTSTGKADRVTLIEQARRQG